MEDLANKASQLKGDTAASLASLGKLLPKGPLFQVHKGTGREMSGPDALTTIEDVDDASESKEGTTNINHLEENQCVEDARELVEHFKSATDADTKSLCTQPSRGSSKKMRESG